MRGRDYRCGQVFGLLIRVDGLSIYHCGSANLIEEAIPRAASEVDLLLLCIAARHATPRFVSRMLAEVYPHSSASSLMKAWASEWSMMYRAPGNPVSGGSSFRAARHLSICSLGVIEAARSACIFLAWVSCGSARG